MKVGIFYMPDKSVIIRTFAPKSKRQDETEGEWMTRIMNKNPRSPVSDIIDSLELPQTREDRDAWRGEKGKGIYIDDDEAQKLRQEKENNQKIANRIRQMAIDKLIEEGELPSDYKRKKDESR